MPLSFRATMTCPDLAARLLNRPLPIADAADRLDADSLALRERYAQACPSLVALAPARPGFFLHRSAAYRLGRLAVCAAAHLPVVATGDGTADCTLLLPTHGRAHGVAGGRHYVLEAGQSALLVAGEAWELRTELYAGLAIACPRDLLQQALALLTAAGGPALPAGSVRIALHRPETRRTLTALPAMLRAALSDPAAYAGTPRPRLEAEVLQALAGLVADALNVTHVDLRSGDQARGVDAACGYMLEHLGESITATDLECHTAVARAALEAQFRERFGVSPLRWLKTQRLLAARRLLRAGAYGSVTETARACGFTHFGRFSHDFKTAFGLAPRAAHHGGDATRPRAHARSAEHRHRATRPAAAPAPVRGVG